MVIENLVLLSFFTTFAVLAENTPAPAELSKREATCVSTFHCLSVYWSPEGGAPEKKVFLKFRESSETGWREGLAMLFNPVKVPECKGDYRGSIVNLKPGTSYEVALSLEGTDVTATLKAATWSENLPVASTNKIKDHETTLEVKTSGTAEGYVLYDGTGCVLDCGNMSDVGIAVNASYVILRGFTIRNAKHHGIRIFTGHHIVIEDCDISKWGSDEGHGFGFDLEGAVFSDQRDVRSVVVQRCKLHHPSWGLNSWAQPNSYELSNPKIERHCHPMGPGAIVLWESAGNHVFRYNECWSDSGHYFNDVLGGQVNGSYRGYPGQDSDIYCNYIANCWDDGIEAEGGGQNVRIWNNYIEEAYTIIANAPCTIGPTYIWRNVSGRSYTPPGNKFNFTHGAFLKKGHGKAMDGGNCYVFNNTIWQPNDEGAYGLGGVSKVIMYCVSRNNILHVRSGDKDCISNEKKISKHNDFDYDLLSTEVSPPNHEKHGIIGKPVYVKDAGFAFASKTGNFQLRPDSPGFDKGETIPNFCDTGKGAPDIGAHEASTPPMVFGLKALFSPPQ
jgi:hypothetical protein